MDRNVEIQLGETTNISSINVDNYINLTLENNQNRIVEFDVKHMLDISEQFEIERQSTQKYRIYGGLEYLSLLNNITERYYILSDFFIKKENNIKDIFNSFDFYLVRPYNYPIHYGFTDLYVRHFEVIATNNDFHLLNAGFSKNIFNENKYSFVFRKGFDISEMFDEFGFPLTEFFLYAKYKKRNIVGYDEELVNGKQYTSTTYRKRPISDTAHNIGDIIYGDKIIYDRNQYLQYVEDNQTYFISTPYRIIDNFGNISQEIKYLCWKYNPFIPIRLRYLSNELSKSNINTTNYDQQINIPSYATNIGNGNYVWRELLDEGYVDPLSGIGNDHPLLNGYRYVFSNLNLSIIPDLDDENTSDVFKNIKFGSPSIINVIPIGDLNNIGSPCN
jgi:hypothetical protein